MKKEEVENFRKELEKNNAWGISSSIDLHSCNPDSIRNEKKIKQFVKELCEKIDMKRFGETTVVHFGENPQVEGFSMTQLIETSLISAHFAEATNDAFLDVFSCKFYNPHEIAEFSKEFFQADDYKLNYLLRK